MTTKNPARTALITGASRGLGLALAQQLAQRGWQLIITARGAEALARVKRELAPLTRLIALAGDVTETAHRQALANAAQALGGLDAVINNAGILGPSPQPQLLDYDLEVLATVFQANTLAPLGVIQAVRDRLKPAPRLLNITSDAAVEAYPGWGGYGSSKAALEHLSAILAAENPHWRVYWVDPGDMRTQMQQEAFPGEDISDRPLPETSVPGLVQLLEGDYPSGRYRARHLEPLSPVHEMRFALTVENIDEARHFYHDALGLPIEAEWAGATGHGLLLGAGRATLELLDRPMAEHVDQVEAGRRVAGPVRLALEVDNVAKTGNRLQAHGAQALNGLVETPWGDRNQRLRTPEGLQLTLFQVKKEE